MKTKQSTKECVSSRKKQIPYENLKIKKGMNSNKKGKYVILNENLLYRKNISYIV